MQWLRRHASQQSIASDADQREVGVKVKPEQKAEGDYSDDSSFNWKVTNRIENVGPAKNAQIQDQCDCEDNAPHTTPELAGDPLSGAERDAGGDPYNTAGFHTAHK